MFHSEEVLEQVASLHEAALLMSTTPCKSFTHMHENSNTRPLPAYQEDAWRCLQDGSDV